MRADQDASAGGGSASVSALSSLRKLLPRSDLPGARQRTPFRINRYMILTIYIIYVFLTGCVYFGWASISSMLLRGRRFESLCDRDEEGNYVVDMTEERGYICDDQEAAVQHLYTLTFAVHTTMSSVAGLALDLAGPLITSVVGQIFNFTGWALLASSGESGSVGDAAVYAAFVFIGMGADLGFLPTLCITRLFPGSAGLAITLLGSAASASFAIPLILESIVKSMHVSDPKNVFWTYAAAGPGLCIILAILFIPRRGYVDFRSDEECKKCNSTNCNCNEKEKENSGSNNKDGNSIKESISNQDIDVSRDSNVTEDSNAGINVNKGDNKDCNNGNNANISGNDNSNPMAKGSSKESIARMVEDKERGVEGKGSTANALESSKTSVSFTSQLFSCRYIVLTIYFVGVGWASSFYQEAHNRLLSESVRGFLKILLPLSFIPCVMWGYIADRIGIIRVIFITNISGLLMYLFTFGGIEFLGYLSVLCFTNYMSIFTSQVFVYIEQNFVYVHFGKLIGIIQMVGGLLSLACNPLYSKVALNPKIPNGLQIVQGIMVGLLLLQFLWIALLVCMARKRKSAVYVHPKTQIANHEEHLESTQGIMDSIP